MSKVSWAAIYIHAAMFVVLITVLSFQSEAQDIPELQAKIECLEAKLNASRNHNVHETCMAED